MENTCGHCGRRDVALRRCTGCWNVRYCSPDCQRRHWSRHKVTCSRQPVTSSPPAQENTKEPAKEGEVPFKSEDPLSESNEETSAGDTDHVASGSEPPKEGATAVDEEDKTLKTCQKCKTKKQNMKKCGRCLNVTYCSCDCQTADWSSHKVTCQPIEVLTTEGYRETERREAEAAAAAAARRQSGENLLEFLLRQNRLPTASPTHQRLSWSEARTRAARLFPLEVIVDDFNALDSDFMGSPFRLFPSWMSEDPEERGEGVVAVGRLTSPYFHPFRPARSVEDVKGMSVYVIFYTSIPPWPFFQYSQLREGNFICIQGAYLHLFADGSVGFRVEDVSSVRILEPRP